MDFSLPHIHEASLVTSSNIRHIDAQADETTDNVGEPSADRLLIEEANKAATNLFLGNWKNVQDDHLISDEERRILTNSTAYPERSTPQTERITEDSLVVIFESFDNLKFCYPRKGKIFSNRNGHFHHDDFIGKPFGCKIRSRNNQGYGFVYLLKPTPELWSRSLNHRTQIIHFLDASMIVFYLNIRPNMVVCESGTGSGALSHCIMRSIAPRGMLHTYEFNQKRAETAREEFASNGLAHLSRVYHRDVCGKHGPGGFDRPQASVDAIVLDLPEPWLAVPHAAYCIKKNARIVSYSPCIEQSQKTIEALKRNGFHTIKTMEFRLKENYVDEVEYDMPPTEKRQRIEDHRVYPDGDKEVANDGVSAAAKCNIKKGIENEGNSNTGNKNIDNETNTNEAKTAGQADPSDAPTKSEKAKTDSPEVPTSKPRPKRKLVARPFVIMRGHTAFLTFATAGNALRPKP